MQKVYLLLRNNKQTGPYSLEELIQQHIKSPDLIWIEGKSNGWSYPVEIESLRPYLDDSIKTNIQDVFSNQPEISDSGYAANKSIVPKTIYVSLPKSATNNTALSNREAAPTDLEKKADELKKKVLAYSGENAQPLQEPIRTNYTRSMNAVEEEYTAWAYQQKTKKKKGISREHLKIALLTGIVMVCIFFASDYYFDAKEDSPKPLTLDHNTKGDIAEPRKEQTGIITEATVEKVTVPIEGKQLVKVREKKSQKILQEPTVPTELPAAKNNEIINDPQQPSEELSKDVKEKKDNEGIVTTPVEKKKSLGAKIEGFFEKFKTKKEEKETTEEKEPSPRTTPSPGSSERKAVRRGDETPAITEPSNLAEKIEIKANTPDNWMMGIRDLKITLYNRSEEWIKTATVEVRYYDTQNTLLEKKIVSFSNIPPNQRSTVPAPDHRIADHTDYQLLTVIAKDEAYAKQ